MPDLKQTHTFYKKDGYWDSEDNDLDCNLCTIGYALIVAATFHEEFQGFSEQKTPDNGLVFETPLSNFIDYEIHFTKGATNFVIEQILADYMNYTRGTEYTIEKNHFHDLLKEVITIIRNGGNQFTLIEEENDLYDGKNSFQINSNIIDQ